jgi:hypothetical protein
VEGLRPAGEGHHQGDAGEGGVGHTAEVEEEAEEVMGVDLTDLSHSYPFLHLSRKFGVEYYVVLALADGYDARYLLPPLESEPYNHCARAVHAVCHAPWRWQFPPEGRGL